jgi:putative acetyltransferase
LLQNTANLQGMKPQLDQITIREIQPGDNAALAVIIRNALTEFGANKPGTVYYDASTDALYELFRKPASVYYVAEYGGELLGGGGIFPSDGLPEGTCELVKMYLKPEGRGIGLGSKLIQKSLAFAKEAGYENVYLETMPELQQALTTYARFGFEYIDHPIGNTGHHGCDLWMLKKL